MGRYEAKVPSWIQSDVMPSSGEAALHVTFLLLGSRHMQLTATEADMSSLLVYSRSSFSPIGHKTEVVCGKVFD
ncbi:hypothetical protein EYF80_001243 [Liparis tanakae]|uniref:Uncharacterized protein n=1 Tax=Liparis tanakae TaxID=230148 RepID=A0A4Z2JEM1_9TELE|nr:hypothetical protein EYF80_001243 [Liparis tanakae]